MHVCEQEGSTVNWRLEAWNYRSRQYREPVIFPLQRQSRETYRRKEKKNSHISNMNRLPEAENRHELSNQLLEPCSLTLNTGTFHERQKLLIWVRAAGRDCRHLFKMDPKRDEQIKTRD